jgi:hypothetical protein
VQFGSMKSPHSIPSVVLAVLCIASAIGDSLKLQSVLRAAKTVRCPHNLGTILGLIVGFSFDEIAPAVGLSIYLVLAIGVHLRVKDHLKPCLPSSCSQSAPQLLQLPSESVS